ncbi:MAG: glycosyltransferase family 2 protein [Lachnospiraceae bacterium]|nr:glycosyltransferase family 2 protein [Lachnospiraceae bacterium]
MPKVSVIMGVYNGKNGLKRAIDSILNQTFEDFEFLICDDASTDGSSEILKAYAFRDRRIKIFTNRKNRKLAASLNRCIRAASGEYIARMDDDDYSHRERLAKQVAFLEQHPEYAFVGTAAARFDKNGIWGKSFGTAYPDLKQCYKKVQFIHPSVMMRSDLLREVGGYTENKENERSQDYDLWCKFYQKGYQGCNLQETLFYYRESQRSIQKRKKRYRIDFLKKQLRWRRRLKLPVWYDIYAWIEVYKIMMPNFILLHMRKRRLQKGLS